MSAGSGRAVDTGRANIVWAPEPYCMHEEGDDCEHGVWVDTRVTRDTLADGSLTLALREDEEDLVDDGGYVIVGDAITVTCSLDSGVIAAGNTAGEIFLRRHPWLADTLREELPVFHERAERVAAQSDRESAAREALARPAKTMVRYSDLFPADWDLVPVEDGEEYWAVDLYCRNPDCDCASSVILFYRLDDDPPRLVGEVAIDYAKDEPDVKASTPEAGEIFDSLWAASEYTLRARHAEASRAVRRFSVRAIHTAAARAPTPAAAGVRVPRNAPCSCGSGKKYKRCCLDAQMRGTA